MKKPSKGYTYYGMCYCDYTLTPSLYKFAKEQNTTNARKMCLWVATKLHFVCGKLWTTNSFQWMAKQQ